MLTLSFRLTKKKIFIGGTLLACIIILIVCAFSISAKNGNKADLYAPDDSARCEFLEKFGWTVICSPIEVEEVQIPAEFGEVYERYNTLQKAQGFDLSLFKLCRVKRYTYEITNYEGAEGVRANLLVYNDKIIGGDISTVDLGGFMHEINRRPSEEELVNCLQPMF